MRFGVLGLRKVYGLPRTASRIMVSFQTVSWKGTDALAFFCRSGQCKKSNSRNDFATLCTACWFAQYRTMLNVLWICGLLATICHNTPDIFPTSRHTASAVVSQQLQRLLRAGHHGLLEEHEPVGTISLLEFLCTPLAKRPSLRHCACGANLPL